MFISVASEGVASGLFVIYFCDGNHEVSREGPCENPDSHLILTSARKTSFTKFPGCCTVLHLSRKGNRNQQTNRVQGCKGAVTQAAPPFGKPPLPSTKNPHQLSLKHPNWFNLHINVMVVRPTFGCPPIGTRRSVTSGRKSRRNSLNLLQVSDWVTEIAELNPNGSIE